MMTMMMTVVEFWKFRKWRYRNSAIAIARYHILYADFSFNNRYTQRSTASKHTLSAKRAGSKSSGNFRPFIWQIFRISLVTSSYWPFTASHLGDSGIASLHKYHTWPINKSINQNDQNTITELCEFCQFIRAATSIFNSNDY